MPLPKTSKTWRKWWQCTNTTNLINSYVFDRIRLSAGELIPFRMKPEASFSKLLRWADPETSKIPSPENGLPAGPGLRYASQASQLGWMDGRRRGWDRQDACARRLDKRTTHISPDISQNIIKYHQSAAMLARLWRVWSLSSLYIYDIVYVVL